MSWLTLWRVVCCQAVQSVHQPANLEVAEAARVRLAFDELLFMQLTLLVRRALSRCGQLCDSSSPWANCGHLLLLHVPAKLER